MTLDNYINERIYRRDFLTKALGGLTALMGHNTLIADDYKPRERISMSPNYTRNKEKRRVFKIVLYTTECTGKSAEDTFLNRENKISPHYLIMEDGEIVKMVEEKEIAWHCKNYNSNSIGIKIAGYYNKKINGSQIKSAVCLIKRLKKEYKLTDKAIKEHSKLDPERGKGPGEENMNAILSALKNDSKE